MPRTLRLEPMVELGSTLHGGELVAFNVGADNLIYIVLALNPLDYRHEENQFSFAKSVPDRPQSYRVMALDGGSLQYAVELEDVPLNIQDVQPLPDSELLLACCRSYRRSPDDFDKNGLIYSRQGLLVREILLGDGIQRLQSTAQGLIWTGFFDEGVFGNYGWDEPIGASGLIAWNSLGEKQYEFEAIDGLRPMCDCYALNVVSDDEIWCYYYDTFPLVRIYRQQIDTFWNIPVSGSGAFAVASNLVLFRGGYNRCDTYHLLQLFPDKKAKELSQFQVQDENGISLKKSRVVSRGSSIYMLNDSRLYRLDTEMAA